VTAKKRSGWHRAKPAAINDALPSATALELVPSGAVSSLRRLVRLRRAACGDKRAKIPKRDVRETELMTGRSSIPGRPFIESPKDRAWMTRLRKQQRRSLAMCLDVYRLSSEDAHMTRSEAVDAVASGFACDPRTVTRACDDWLIDSLEFRQVLTQYRSAVQKRLAQRDS
jgi:hypothetical protein